MVLGVLGFPNYAFDLGRPSGPGSIFYAVKGEIAFARSIDTGKQREITTDSISEGGQAKFCESVESAHASHEEHAQIATALNISIPGLTARPSLQLWPAEMLQFIYAFRAHAAIVKKSGITRQGRNRGTDRRTGKRFQGETA